MGFKYIDISTHNGDIDFSKLAGKVDGVIIRAGYGKNNIDKRFKQNAEGCAKYNIPFGVYWFSYATTAAEAAQEAAYCLAAIKPYKVQLPVCFDLEYDSVAYAKKKGVTIDRALASDMARAFCEAVEKAGYFAMNYANEDYCKNYFDTDILRRFGLWYARYTKQPVLESRPRNCGIWQYTSSGSMAGISGNVDINYAYLDYAAIIAEAGLNHLPKQAEAEQVGAWYEGAQLWAIAKGITDGSNPTEPATRAEVWAMLQRLERGK